MSNSEPIPRSESLFSTVPDNDISKSIAKFAVIITLLLGQ